MATTNTVIINSELEQISGNWSPVRGITLQLLSSDVMGLYVQPTTVLSFLKQKQQVGDTDSSPH